MKMHTDLGVVLPYLHPGKIHVNVANHVVIVYKHDMSQDRLLKWLET